MYVFCASDGHVRFAHFFLKLPPYSVFCLHCCRGSVYSMLTRYTQCDFFRMRPQKQGAHDHRLHRSLAAFSSLWHSWFRAGARATASLCSQPDQSEDILSLPAHCSFRPACVRGATRRHAIFCLQVCKSYTCSQSARFLFFLVFY